MRLNILLYCFCLVALVGQKQQCDAAELFTAPSALQGTIEDWFPQDIEFNESCVAEGCPGLQNMTFCPSDLDLNAMRKITKTISDCMSGPICGIVIEPRPIKYREVSMDQLLPGLHLTTIATFAPGSGYVSNTSNIELDVMPNTTQNSPIQLSVLMPAVRFHGYYPIDFHLNTGVGPGLTASIQKSTYEIVIKFLFILSINCTGPNIDIQFENPFLIVSPQLCGIDLPTGFPDIQAVYTASMRKMFEDSTMAKAIGRFMGKLYTAAIQVVSRNCK